MRLICLAGFLVACSSSSTPQDKNVDAARGPDAVAVDGRSPGDGAVAGVGCYNYAGFQPTVVAFVRDVMPIFTARCAQCHRDESASTYYGSNASVVYSKLKFGVPTQAPQLKFVEPGNPVVSYMLAKIEYANPGGTCSLVQCQKPGCELFAPPGQMLPESERAIIRSWIMTGAKFD